MTKLAHIRSPFGGSPHIFIATPAYDGKPCGAYVVSLAQSLPRLMQEGIAFDYFLMSGNCHVDDSRNGCLREFLKTPCTDLVFIDADVGWNAEDLVRLCRYDRDVVAGVYPKKTPDNVPEEYPVDLYNGEELRADADGLLDVPGAPTGFMRIRRRVVEKLVEANKHRQFTGQNESDSDPYTIVFERTFDEGRRRSGDYAFCRSWRQFGGKVFVDPEMRFVHEGAKEWLGCLGDHLREKAGILHPALIEGIRELRSGDTSHAVFAKIFGGWGNPYAASPCLAMSAYLAALGVDGPILETGSGMTTVLMGIAADQTGQHVHALEHDLDYLRKTWKALEFFGIRNVTLHYAPLRPWSESEFWYGPQAELPAKFALVLCDGPQQRFGRGGLYHFFGDRIENAHILMDDAVNQGELAQFEQWASGVGREVRVIPVARGERSFAVCGALPMAAE